VVDEACEDIGIVGSVRAGLVVDLPADDGGVVLVVLGEVGDDALGVEAELGVVGVHILAHPVADFAAAEVAGVELGVRLGHPGGHGVGGRAHDDLDAGLAHGVDDAVHPGVFEVAVGGLPEAPGGLAHADDGDAGVLHQRDVLFKAAGLEVGGHVLVVVGRAIEYGGQRRAGRGSLCLQ